MKSSAFAKAQSHEESHRAPDDTSFPMLRDQYYDRISRARRLDGESRLLFAVLEDAVHCYTVAARSGRPCHQLALDEARQWVNTRGDRYLFSFDSICRVFDLEPELLRDRLNSLGGATMRPCRFRKMGRSTVLTSSE